MIGDFCSEAKKLVRIELPLETLPELGFRQGEYADWTKQESTDTKITEA
jgi:hypothetical protein